MRNLEEIEKPRIVHIATSINDLYQLRFGNKEDFFTKHGLDLEAFNLGLPLLVQQRYHEVERKFYEELKHQGENLYVEICPLIFAQKYIEETAGVGFLEKFPTGTRFQIDDINLDSYLPNGEVYFYGSSWMIGQHQLINKLIKIENEQGYIDGRDYFIEGNKVRLIFDSGEPVLIDENYFYELVMNKKIKIQIPINKIGRLSINEPLSSNYLKDKAILFLDHFGGRPILGVVKNVINSDNDEQNKRLQVSILKPKNSPEVFRVEYTILDDPRIDEVPLRSTKSVLQIDHKIATILIHPHSVLRMASEKEGNLFLSLQERSIA